MALEYVNYAFMGIQACVPFIIITAGIKMLMKEEKTPFNIIITSVVIVCMILFSLLSIKFSSIYYILLGGVVGVVTYFINTIITNKKNKNRGCLTDSQEEKSGNIDDAVEIEDKDNGKEEK